MTLNNDKKKRFNLKNNEREKALSNAWFSMQNDSKYANKKFKIITDVGEKIILKISDIKDCKQENCFYSKSHIMNIKEKIMS